MDGRNPELNRQKSAKNKMTMEKKSYFLGQKYEKIMNDENFEWK